MSLFGSTAAKPATGGGLFGNLGATNNSASGTSTSAAPSLFGNTTSTAQSQPSGGLFGNLGQNTATNSTATTTTNMFGKNPASEPAGVQAPRTSLFGTLGGPAKDSTGNAGASGGLFGTSTTNQAPSGSLFGAPNTSQPAQSSGFFGSTTTSQAGPSQSLFGGAAATSQPAGGGSLFGNPTTNQATGAGGMFAQQNNTNLQASSNDPSAQTKKAGTRQPAYFDQLLERSRKRQNGENANGTFDQLPTLQLGLGDIARKVRNMGQGSPAGATKQGGSHYLLAASGVNTGAALRDLNALSADVAAPLPTSLESAPVPDTDLEGYVDGLYRQSSLDLVEQALSRAKKDFDDFLEEHVQTDWEQQRRRIYQHFGIVKADDDVEEDLGTSVGPEISSKGAFGRSSRRGRMGKSASGLAVSGLTKSVLGTPSMRGSRASGFDDVAEKSAGAGLQPAPEDRLQRDKQARYSDKVKSLNVARLEESSYPLLQQFAEVESQPSVEDTTHFVNCFKALAEIVEETSASEAKEASKRAERRFATDYLEDSAASRKGFELRKRILDGSRRFLEKQFLSNVEAAVVKNPREANLGGVPTITNKIRGFVRIKSARKELGADNVELQMLGDDFVWVLIFYLIRAGLISEAAAYVAENERAIKSMDRHFPTYLASYARSEDRRLTPELQSRIMSEYTQRTRIAPENSLDPFRMACYKVIGRCGLSKRNLEGVNQSMEDWVWLQFALAREVNRVEETAAEVFGLEDVRQVIHEIGQRHFVQGGEGSAAHQTYFFLQILAGQFEAAVAWLYPHNYLTAVHFALALNYYGLLRVNDFNGSDDLLSYTTRQQPQISYGHMIGYYTRDFRAADPSAAADYLTTICLNGDVPGEQGKRQTELCHEALRELVLETREFAQLLGDIRSDGQRIKGAIEQRLNLIRIDDEKQYLQQITIGAAQIADENGRVTDAVLLYHLAEEYDDVVSVCCRALSDAISVDAGSSPLRLEPLKPRAVDAPTSNRQRTPETPASSLSLTSVTDPVQLASNMNGLYKANSLLYQRVRPANRGQIELLLLISRAKSLHDEQKWAQCLDTISSMNILPLSASGSMSIIRDRAASFNSLPPLVAKLVGQLLIWSIRSVGGQKAVLEAEGWGPERREVVDRLGQCAKDCMVFAGVVRYRLGGRVWEALAGAGEGIDN